MLKELLRRNLEVLERYTVWLEKPKTAAPAGVWEPPPAAEAAAALPQEEALPMEDTAHQTRTHVIYEGMRAAPASETSPARSTAAAALPLEAFSEQIQMQSRRYPRVLSSDGEQI